MRERYSSSLPDGRSSDLGKLFCIFFNSVTDRSVLFSRPRDFAQSRMPHWCIAARKDRSTKGRAKQCSAFTETGFSSQEINSCAPLPPRPRWFPPHLI